LGVEERNPTKDIGMLNPTYEYAAADVRTKPGKYKGYWPVSAFGNWCVIFQFEDNSAVFAVHFDSFGGNLFQIGKTIPQNSCIVD